MRVLSATPGVWMLTIAVEGHEDSWLAPMARGDLQQRAPRSATYGHQHRGHFTSRPSWYDPMMWPLQHLQSLLHSPCLLYSSLPRGSQQPAQLPVPTRSCLRGWATLGYPTIHWATRGTPCARSSLWGSRWNLKSIMARLVQVVHITAEFGCLSNISFWDACYTSYARAHLWLPRSGGVLIMHAWMLRAIIHSLDTLLLVVVVVVIHRRPEARTRDLLPEVLPRKHCGYRFRVILPV